MNTEDRVLATLAKSNPVPDVNDIELVQVGHPIYLATLAKRRSEMTDIDISPDTGLDHKDDSGQGSGNKSRTITWWLIAAVAVLVVGTVGYFLIAEDTPVPPVGTEQPVVTEPGSATDPQSTLEHYIAAYNAGDLNGIMALFTEASTVTGHPYSTTGSETGLEEIRTFQNIDLAAAADANAYTISNIEVSGDTVTWDHAWVDRLGRQFCKSGMSAVVEDGKFVSFTWPSDGFGC